MKLIIIILNFSYLLAMFWFIMCRFVEDFFLGVDYNLPDDAVNNDDTFIVNYGLQFKNTMENTIILTYFSFTSLSTVGFGDYAPISNLERLIGAFMLLSGVAIFSYIMGNFIEILEKYKAFNKDYEEGEQLSRFFGAIKAFNNDQDMLEEHKLYIEEYFDYRWKNDKNVALDISCEENSTVLNQMPETVIEEILKSYQWKPFLHKFKKTFVFPNMDNEYKHSYYTWSDEAYRNFMFEVLSFLEPRKEAKGRVLLCENDEVNEVLFFDHGIYAVGYELNKVVKLVKKFKNANVIGAY